MKDFFLAAAFSSLWLVLVIVQFILVVRFAKWLWSIIKKFL